MSNAGQAVLSIVGAVVGFYIGGPEGAIYGFQLGYLAGSVIFPTQLPALQGPRLGEGNQTRAVVGSPIPIVFGTQTVGGIIIWAGPIREVAKNSDVGGKGGPEQSQTTYTYYRSFAVLLCEGPIGGVRRIWFNGKIVYDLSPTQFVPANPDNFDSSSEALSRLQLTGLFYNQSLHSNLSLYLGNEDQLPDPTIEAVEGVGNVPAYRGYAYIVFHDLELKPEDGNRIPAQMKFEVFEDGASTETTTEQYEQEVLYPWIQAPSGGLPIPYDPRNPLAPDAAYSWEVTGFNGSTGGATGPLPTYDQAVSAWVNWYNTTYAPGSHLGEVQSWGVSRTLFGHFWPAFTEDTNQFPGDGTQAFLVLVEKEIKIGQYLQGPLPGGGSAEANALIALGADLENAVLGYYLSVTAAWYSKDHNTLSSPWDGVWTAQYSNVYSDGGSFEYYYAPTIWMQINRVPVAPPNPCNAANAIALPSAPDFCIIDGVIHIGGDWEYDAGNYRVLRKYQDSTVQDIYPLGPARPEGHPDYDDEDFWTEQYELARERGLVPSGWTYGMEYPVFQGYAYKKSVDSSTVEVEPVTLADIVSRICARVGMTDIDVSDLEEIPVHGYTITRPMAARGAIEPLRSYGFFDVVESGGSLIFSARGKPAVAALEVSDLAAHFAEQERPSLITTRKLQEKELPRQIRVTYQSIERDYDPGEELSPNRVDTEAESVVTVEVPVAMTSTQAAKIAEILHRDLWAGRWLHTVFVDVSKSAIEAGDAITVPVDGRQQRVRVPNVVEKIPNLRQLDLIRDDDGSYVSYAIGTEIVRTPTAVNVSPPTTMELLDIPALRAEDNNPGVYAALRSALREATFRGATVYKSIDGGVSYSAAASASSDTILGRLVAVLPSGPSTIWDEDNELRVELDEAADLESRSESDVLGGANTVAIGADGRWEIVQFRTATHVIKRIWSLTGLLRGRRGTEHNIGTSVYGDRFVFLSAGGLIRVPLTVAEVNAPRFFKAVAVGVALSDQNEQEFTGRGVALKPFSPVDIAGDRDDDGNITITWTRRDRMAIDYVPGAATPMSETAEDYEVEILGDADEVLRTISVSTQSAVYTADQQVTDFGDTQLALVVRVYQISTAVGRGYPGEATV